MAGSAGLRGQRRDRYFSSGAALAAGSRRAALRCARWTVPASSWPRPRLLGSAPRPVRDSEAAAARAASSCGAGLRGGASTGGGAETRGLGTLQGETAERARGGGPWEEVGLGAGPEPGTRGGVV